MSTTDKSEILLTKEDKIKKFKKREHVFPDMMFFGAFFILLFSITLIAFHGSDYKGTLTFTSVVIMANIFMFSMAIISHITFENRVTRETIRIYADNINGVSPNE